MTPPFVSVEKRARIAENLIAWYRAHKRDLPWRGGSPYAVWVSEMMLQQNDHRTEVRAILTYLAQHDSMIGVHEPAQNALEADARRQERSQPSPLFPLQQTNAHDMIGVRCKKCSHVTHFNKQRICTESRPVLRGEKDKLKLKCENCGEMMMVEVDCEGYK